MLRADFQTLAQDRIDDARALLSAQRWSGAYYLSGYAIECALKACIAKRTVAQSFPPPRAIVQKLYTHDLAVLVGLAGVKDSFDTAQAKNGDLAKNWLVVKDWTEQSRYAQKTQREATDMVDAVGATANGVLTWLKAHW